MVRKNIDLSLFIMSAALLTVIGLIFIYSSSSVFALEKLGSAHYFVKKQFLGLIVGIIGMIMCTHIPLSFIKKYTPLFFIVTFFLTLATQIPPFATQINGSYRWITFFGFSFQPSELLKVSFILYIAYFLTKKQYQRNSFMHGYLPFLCILGLTGLLLLKQPDFGQAVTLCTTAFILFFIAQMRLAFLFATLIPVIPLLALLVFLKPYRLHRILTFLNPWEDRQGAGFQIIQSLIAIGSGRWCGVGIAQSKQKFFYLPMQHTDFIFSIIAEETGFIGVSFLIFLYTILLYTGFRIAWYIKDSFCQLTVLGFIILINLQALINLCVTTGLLPTKGIGLPFVSYGNSSLVCMLVIVGIIINCAQNN